LGSHTNSSDSGDDGLEGDDCSEQAIGSVTVSSEHYGQLLGNLAAETSAREDLERHVAVLTERDEKSAGEKSAALDVCKASAAVIRLERLLAQQDTSQQELNGCIDSLSKEWDWSGLVVRSEKSDCFSGHRIIEIAPAAWLSEHQQRKHSPQQGQVQHQQEQQGTRRRRRRR